MVIPKSKSDYDYDWNSPLERKKISQRIPVCEIQLKYRQKGQWSADGDTWKNVEEAVSDHLVAQNWVKLEYRDFRICVIACFLANNKNETSLRKRATQLLDFCVTPAMYDEGYPLDGVWREIPSRFSSADKQYISSVMPDLAEPYSLRDVLQYLTSDILTENLSSKKILNSTLEKRIVKLGFPAHIESTLLQALKVYTKHIKQSDIKSGKFLGSVLISDDIEIIIDKAKRVTLEEFKETLPFVIQSVQNEIQLHFKKGLWIGYNSSQIKDRKLTFDAFARDGVFEEYAEKIHGSQWRLLYSLKGISSTPSEYPILHAIFQEIGAEKLITYEILERWRFCRTLNRSGHSDLIFWNGENLKFFEVKSPNDRLRPNQIDYFQSVMEPLGIDYSLIQVSAAH